MASQWASGDGLRELGQEMRRQLVNRVYDTVHSLGDDWDADTVPVDVRWAKYPRAGVLFRLSVGETWWERWVTSSQCQRLKRLARETGTEASGYQYRLARHVVSSIDAGDRG